MSEGLKKRISVFACVLMLFALCYQLYSYIDGNNRRCNYFKAGRRFELSERRAEDFSGKINLNLASREELLTLPNVDTSLADRIISARNEAKFLFMEDLLEIKGVGRALIERLSPYAYVE